ncbi:MAG: tyrosine-type recombinase/integrase [Gemmatimonadaceae bacterium]|nr:tyrosine-type recombinase/integrase [Gemmatimonadaceae bacterium]MBA3557192.1 tyrosine-type recombinase/integrase [Gemmatimonadaceae bacterium]
MPRKRTKSYPGSITKRAATWRVRLCVGGTYHSFTVPGTKVEAQNFATVKHAELSRDHGRAEAGLPAPIRFSALIEDFKTYELPGLSAGAVQSYRSSLGAFKVFFVDKLGDPFVRDIQRGVVKTFIQWRRSIRFGGLTAGTDALAAGVSAHTVARDRRVLHRLFNYAVDKDFLEANPCARVTAPKADKRDTPILSSGELEALLKAAEANPMLSLYILLLAETGVRADSEALQLRWEDVDLATGFLHVKSAPGRRTKSGKSRFIPLTSRLRAALQEHAATFRMAVYDTGRSPFVFHHVITTRSAIAGQQIRSIRRSFENAAATAKVPAGFRRHDLRHRRVTTWLAEGKNVVHVKEALGHADLATTMAYTHMVPEHLRALVEEQLAPLFIAK